MITREGGVHESESLLEERSFEREICTAHAASCGINGLDLHGFVRACFVSARVRVLL